MSRLPLIVRTAALGAPGALLLAACSGSTIGTITQGSGSASPIPTASGSSSAPSGIDPALAPFYTQRLNWAGCGPLRDRPRSPCSSSSCVGVKLRSSAKSVPAIRAW